MEIAFDSATFRILRCDQALARCTEVFQPSLQVGRQSGVLQHQSRLAGEVGHELLLNRTERFACALGQDQRSEQLSLVSNRNGVIHAGYWGQDLAGEWGWRRRRRI